MNLSCPTENRLREFLEGSVDEFEAGQIADHVEDCCSCHLIVSKVESEQDAIVKQLREGIRIERLLEEPEFHQLRKTVSEPPTESTDGIDPVEEVHHAKRLRDYRLVRKIGEGGMGTVYQAIHMHLGKHVAIKILPTDKLRSRRAVQRFRQEMRSVGKVNHSNVVSASDAGSVEGQHFLVMELVQGADLARIIHDQGTLRVADACEIVRQAAIGLQHAHDNGLVHRDVKPSNLMLTIDGTVKVLDLGLAGLNQADFDSPTKVVVTDRLTSVGQIMGTLDYMAPEQITACSAVDGRADIYALGASLFQLLAGRTPCGDRSAETPERIDAVLHQPPLDITAIRSDVPEKLRRLIDRMLAKSADHRPRSAEVVVDELAPFTRDADLVSLAQRCKTSLDMPSADVDVTDDVSLVVSHPNPQRNESTSGSNPTHPDRTRTGLRIGLATMALLVTLLLSVVTFYTPKGTVVIEFDTSAESAGVRVALEQDGETVEIVDSKGDWEIRVAEGNYNVRLLDGEVRSTNDLERFIVDQQTLVVESNSTSPLSVRWLPTPSDPVAIFTSGMFEAGARAAEDLVSVQPNHAWNRAQAAIMWGSTPLIGGSPSENRQRYEAHREWLAQRWSKTREGTSTIPRVCCLHPNPKTDLSAMLKAVTDESAQHPGDWRYPHSRMTLLCRMGNYQEALKAFDECQRVAHSNQMQNAVDHAWLTLILYRLEKVSEGRQAHAVAMNFYHQLRPNGQQELPKTMWFDFVELGALLCEVSLEFEYAPAANSSPNGR